MSSIGNGPGSGGITPEGDPSHTRENAEKTVEKLGPRVHTPKATGKATNPSEIDTNPSSEAITSTVHNPTTVTSQIVAGVNGNTAALLIAGIVSKINEERPPETKT